MLRATKYFAALVAACLLLVFLPEEGSAQNPQVARYLNVSTSEGKLDRDAPRCDLEAEIGPLPHLLMFAELACEPRPQARTETDLCVPMERAELACNAEDERVQFELAALGKRGETIARARTRVLQILQGENACAAWFRQLDLDPARTFRSARFVVDEKGPRYVFGTRQGGQGELLKHPWVASTVENAGRGATIWLNANGAFFNGFSGLIEREQDGGPLRPMGTRVLRVELYSGNTPEAQTTALLHELGHIVGRIPEDSDSLDGESGRNTAEVLRFCRPEIKAVSGKNYRGGR